MVLTAQPQRIHSCSEGSRDGRELLVGRDHGYDMVSGLDQGIKQMMIRTGGTMRDDHFGRLNIPVQPGNTLQKRRIAFNISIGQPD